MKEVIQIYKSVYAIRKTDYNSESRSIINDWPTTIRSKTGYVEDETLFLPDSQRSNPDVKRSGLIIIQDIEGFDPFILNQELKKSNLSNWFGKHRADYLLSRNQQIKCFHSLSSRCDFEIFKITKTSKSAFEFTLNYLSNQNSIGLPKREDHKIADLRRGKPFSYRINGKIDGHSQRVFMEYKYVVQSLGEVDSVEFKSLNRIEVDKSLPNEGLKDIDERKILS